MMLSFVSCSLSTTPMSSMLIVNPMWSAKFESAAPKTRIRRTETSWTKRSQSRVYNLTQELCVSQHLVNGVLIHERDGIAISLFRGFEAKIGRYNDNELRHQD